MLVKIFDGCYLDHELVGMVSAGEASSGEMIVRVLVKDGIVGDISVLSQHADSRDAGLNVAQGIMYRVNEAYKIASC